MNIGFMKPTPLRASPKIQKFEIQIFIHPREEGGGGQTEAFVFQEYLDADSRSFGVFGCRQSLIR